MAVTYKAKTYTAITTTVGRGCYSFSRSVSIVLSNKALGVGVSSSFAIAVANPTRFICRKRAVG